MYHLSSPTSLLLRTRSPLWPHHSFAQGKEYQQPLAGLWHLDTKTSLVQTLMPHPLEESHVPHQDF